MSHVQERLKLMQILQMRGLYPSDAYAKYPNENLLVISYFLIDRSSKLRRGSSRPPLVVDVRTNEVGFVS